jgi:hypothetical protein
VIAGVYVEHFPGHALACIAQQEGGSLSHFCGLGIAPQRRTLRVDVEDVRKAFDARRGKRLDRSSGHGVDADVARTDIGGEIAHGRFERRLRNAHDVVPGDHAFGSEVRQREHTASAALLHQWRGAARQRDQ